MPEPSEPKGREQARAIALAGQLGVAGGTPIVICAVAAYYLEQRFPASGMWVIGGVLLGVAAGIAAAYRLLRPFLYQGDDDKS